MKNWQLFLISEVFREYDLSKKEQAIMLAKFPDEETVKVNRQVADRAFEDDRLPADPETIRRQLWTIYNERFSPKENREHFPDYDRKGSSAKDKLFQAWLKEKYLKWKSLTIDSRSTNPAAKNQGFISPDIIHQKVTEKETNKKVALEQKSPNVLANPFIPLVGRVDDPQLFFGRDREIKQIFEILNSGSSVTLIGEEGIGKSSILWSICQQAGNFLHSSRESVFLDLNWIHDENEFYTALCEEIGIPSAKGYTLTRNLRDRRILLAIDNVGKMTWEGFTRQVRDQLRGLAEGSIAPLRLILAASESLNDLFNDSQDEGKTSPLAGVCQEEIIAPWNENTVRQFIATRLAITKIKFTETEIQQILQESSGHPRELMRLCYQTYSRYVDGIRD
ncbi:ATP-binding protein [Mastigocoleus testarum]|uniref:Novel STAND NTPase 1 domain-containing protein n=1 Tax=Mastigocoleus testarum BC008 TaxID=371196 RepID=A0A0V7ZUF8_9CYAN|nr:ATP-binding protein [Mastigocoleus testarum]KST68293.1 hypothetical protein BC008_00605 [Mastigocoleus testarum BC008]KST68448.1 hypothetical protein BC008_00840 [Mastigocoleus testarum BC008]